MAIPEQRMDNEASRESERDQDRERDKDRGKGKGAAAASGKCELASHGPHIGIPCIPPSITRS
jgi:hypothetical protein